MNEILPYAISIFIGIGLAAATGFRVFTPFFLLSLATYLNWIPNNTEWTWLGSETALITTGIAMVIEVLAYYIPFIDNLLDSIAVPLATVSGTLIFASQFTEVSPFLQWSSAIIAGGGTAATIGSIFAGTRATSSATTAGIANPVVSTLETIGATIMSFLSLFAPVIAVILVIITIYFGVKYSRKIYQKFKGSKARPLN